jgi:hypothetical protein
MLLALLVSVEHDVAAFVRSAQAIERLVLTCVAVSSDGAADPPLTLPKKRWFVIEVSPDRGKPVPLVSVTADGVPRLGVVKVGEVPNTNAPLPVSSVTAAATFALLGVAKAVATPVPSPETPVEIGSPVAFVKVPLDGVPSAGVTSVGEVARTTSPDPVESSPPNAPLLLY